MKRRDAVRHILTGAALPLIGSCGVDRLLSPSFAGATSATGAATLIGAGDLHATSASLARRKRTAGLVRAVLDQDPAARAFMVGDLTHVGTSAELDQYYDPTWGSFKDRTLFTIGNHDTDYATPRGAAYYAYTQAPHFYATSLGSWRIYSLSCGNDGTNQAEQLAWLKADLAQYGASAHLLAMFHYPMFSSFCEYHTQLKGHLNDMTWKARVGPWWQAFQQAGAEIAISGHAHRYERLKKKLADGTVSPNGIRQFVVGTAGVMLRNIVPPAHPDSEKIVIAHGVVRFDLYPDHYAWTFKDEWGAVRDEGSQATQKVLA